MKRKILLIILLIFAFPFKVFAGVVAYDALTVEGKSVMLGAETKGKYFKQGGEVVEFMLNGKPIGKALSGGDAMAYLEFKPAKKGLYKITATSGGGGQKSEALLLCLKNGSNVAFIDVSGGLLASPVSRKPRADSRKAIKELMRSFAVVYIHTEMFGMAVTKDWLRDNGFPPAPLLDWADGRVFDDAASMGLKIRAVIGSPAVIESAKGQKPKAFSFEETEAARYVEDWKEILKELGD